MVPGAVSVVHDGERGGETPERIAQRHILTAEEELVGAARDWPFEPGCPHCPGTPLFSIVRVSVPARGPRRGTRYARKRR